MTHLRRAMLEELQRRNYAKTTVYYYLKAVERFARFFHKSPDQLSQTHLRQFEPENGKQNADFIMFSRVYICMELKCSVTNTS